MKCKCTMSQSLVGDGCDICNPEMAKKLAAERLIEARERYNAIGMRNTSGLTREEKVELQIEYDEASVELFDAMRSTNKQG